MAAGAGGSADREYRRRRAKDRERRKANLPRALLIVGATPFVVYIFVTLVGVPLFNRQLGQGLSDLATSGTEAAPAPAEDVVDAETANSLGVVLAAGATLTMAKAAWGRRQTTEAWRKGAEGERMTAWALDRLPAGYTVLHDRCIPGRRANIDHVVVGPTGICIVETKNLTGRVVIGRRSARYNGRSMDKVVDQAWREAAAVEAALGPEVVARLGKRVRPVVCIHGAEVQVTSWWTAPVVRGVRFCSGRRLRRVVSSGRKVLTPQDIQRVVARLDATLRPALRLPAAAVDDPFFDQVDEPACVCGAPWS